jgi:putative redox protein
MGTAATTTVQLRWLEGLRAVAESEDGIAVQVSAGRQYGEGTAISPMELLLISLGACGALATISILTRLTPGLRAVHTEVVGTTAAELPKVFTEIEVRYTFSGEGLRQEQVEKAMHLMEEKYCPVSAMLSRSVAIRHTWQIEQPEVSEA